MLFFYLNIGMIRIFLLYNFGKIIFMEVVKDSLLMVFIIIIIR